MGVPALVGVCQQASSFPITITSVTFQTHSYGTVSSGGTSPSLIAESEQITTILNSSNNFTVPTDGLAQYYELDDATKQVFHSMQVQYTANTFTESDLPANPNCQIAWEISNFGNPNNAQLMTWALEGNPIQGGFIPYLASQTSAEWTTSDILNRNQVFETTPAVLTSSVNLFDDFIVRSSKGPVTNNTNNLDKIAFAARNLGSATSFDLVIAVTLADGTVARSSPQTITVPAGAVKSNLVTTPTFNITQLETVTLVRTPHDPPTLSGAVAYGDPALVCTLNADNSFTAPDTTMQFLGGSIPNPSPPPEEVISQVGHSFTVTYDTSTLDPATFPEEVTCRYVVTSAGYGASEIGFLQDDNTFTTTLENSFPLDRVLDGGTVVGPSYPADFDFPFYITTDLNGTQWSVRVELGPNLAGQFIASQEQTIQMGAATVFT